MVGKNSTHTLADLMKLPLVVVGNKATVAINVNTETGNICTIPLYLDYDGDEDNFRINLYEALKNPKTNFICKSLVFKHEDQLEVVNVSESMFNAYENLMVESAIEQSPLKVEVVSAPEEEPVTVVEEIKNDRYEKYLKNIMYVGVISFFLGVLIYIAVWFIEK